MKKIFCALMLFWFTVFAAEAVLAAPSWQSQFYATYQHSGLLIAASDALAQGVSSADITKAALKIKGINAFNAIKLVVIAGGEQDAVLKASIESGVSSIITLAAIGEGNEVRSGKKVVKKFMPDPPAPAPIITVGAGLPGGASGGGYVSPSTF